MAPEPEGASRELTPSITPDSPVTPTYWVDMIDVAVELPRGPVGETGATGIGWSWGDGDPSPLTPSGKPDGSFYLDVESGSIWISTGGVWGPSGGSIMGPTGSYEEHDHEKYFPHSAGPANPLTGKLYGNEGAEFDDPIQVGTPSSLNPGLKDAVNIEYLQRENRKVDLTLFFGLLNQNHEAIFTGGHDWNAAVDQGIYQQIAGNNAPPGIPKLQTDWRTIGLVQKLTETTRAQTVLDVQRNMVFTRVQNLGNWSDWVPLTKIVDTVSPDEYVSTMARTGALKWGDKWADGQMWVQLEGKPDPEPEPNRGQ